MIRPAQHVAINIHVYRLYGHFMQNELFSQNGDTG